MGKKVLGYLWAMFSGAMFALGLLNTAAALTAELPLVLLAMYVLIALAGTVFGGVLHWVRKDADHV